MSDSEYVLSKPYSQLNDSEKREYHKIKRKQCYKGELLKNKISRSIELLTLHGYVTTHTEETTQLQSCITFLKSKGYMIINIQTKEVM